MHDENLLSELIDRLREGDQRAAAELVRQYEPELRRFVRYRLTDARIRSLIDSVDVTQSVFASFFVALAEGRLDVASPGQLVRLLTTMATNKLHDHHRKSRTAKRAAFRSDVSVREPEENVATNDMGPDDLTESRDFVDAFRSQLAPSERDLLDWRMEGRGWDEIAAKSDSSPEAIRKRFSRAIDRVAEKMGLVNQR